MIFKYPPQFCKAGEIKPLIPWYLHTPIFQREPTPVYHCGSPYFPEMKMNKSKYFPKLRLMSTEAQKRKCGFLCISLLRRLAQKCTKVYISGIRKKQMNPMVATDFCKIMRFSRNSSVTMVTIEFFLDSITKIWFY